MVRPCLPDWTYNRNRRPARRISMSNVAPRDPAMLAAMFSVYLVSGVTYYFLHR